MTSPVSVLLVLSLTERAESYQNDGPAKIETRLSRQDDSSWSSDIRIATLFAQMEGRIVT